MRLQADPPLHLTYCLNIHPGERWSENLAAIREHTLSVRDAVSGGRPFGLGLRLSRTAAEDLAQPATLDSFRRFLADEDLYVFTVNGFPYGRFHGGPVKQDVYSPDWRTPERRDYTLLLADILAGLVPDGVAGSISTVPCSYKGWIASDEDVRRLVHMLMDCVAHVARIRERTGKEILIALEPEPDCTIENTDEAIAFFKGPLREYGRGYLADQLDVGRPEAGEILANHLGLCMDICHLAVQFEDPERSMKRLTEEGIRICKVHISAAVQARPTETAMTQLKGFCDPVYLHQVHVRMPDHSERCYPDLHHALDDSCRTSKPGVEWRIHFHVPVYSTAMGDLQATTCDLAGGFWRAVSGGVTSHLEIETYTFNLLPDSLEKPDVREAIVREYRWVMERLPSAAGPQAPVKAVFPA